MKRASCGSFATFALALPSVLGNGCTSFGPEHGLLPRDQLCHFCISTSAGGVNEALDAGQRGGSNALNILLVRRVCLDHGLQQRGSTKLLRLDGAGFVETKVVEERARIARYVPAC